MNNFEMSVEEFPVQTSLLPLSDESQTMHICDQSQEASAALHSSDCCKMPSCKCDQLPRSGDENTKHGSCELSQENVTTSETCVSTFPAHGTSDTEQIHIVLDQPISCKCVETILGIGESDEETSATDKGLTTNNDTDIDAQILEELLSSIDVMMETGTKLGHDESVETTPKSQPALTSITRSLRLSNRPSAIFWQAQNDFGSMHHTVDRISNTVIKCDPKLGWHFDLKQRNDAADFGVNGIVWVGAFIAVAISESNLVNLIDVNSKSVVSTHYCDAEPFSITAIAEGAYLMVCLPDSSKIDVLTIFNKCLICVLEINCDIPIYDLVHLYDCTFYGLASLTGELYQIQLHKSQLSKVITTKSIKQMLKGSFKLTFDKRLAMLYVSSCERNKVVGIAANGKVQFIYSHKDLQYPFQAAVHQSGNIFLTSMETNCVHVVTESLNHPKRLLVGKLRGPRGICFNDAQDKIAVVDSTPGKELQIYSIKTLSAHYQHSHQPKEYSHAGAAVPGLLLQGDRDAVWHEAVQPGSLLHRGSH